MNGDGSSEGNDDAPSAAVDLSDPHGRLAELGLVLPAPFPSFGSYVMAVLDGTTLYTAGHLPVDGSALVTGKLGEDLSVEQGVRAARCAALSLLSTLHDQLGDLGRVHRVLHLTGTVNAAPHFTDHTAVIDGASDLIVAVFGDRGRHARLAVGVNSLPADVALEVQAVVSIHGSPPN